MRDRRASGLVDQPVYVCTGLFRLKHLRLGRDVSARDLAVTDAVNSSLASSCEAVLGGNALHTVSGVDVLDKSDLPASSSTLAGGDGRRGQEVLPDLLFSQ